MHPMLRRKLFGLVVGLVVTLPFVLHGIGHKGWDPIGQAFGILSKTSSISSTLMEQMAVSTLDPSIAEANATALASGRTTTLADVWQTLTDNGYILDGSAQNPNPAPIPTPSDLIGLTDPTAIPPTFTQTSSSITAGFVVLGIHGSCIITINNGTTSRTCK